MPEFGFLECSVGPGMFDNECSITLKVGGRRVASVVEKENVKVERQPAGDEPGMGWLRVRIVDLTRDVALVDLPQPALTSEPRLKVPASVLRMTA